MNYHLWRSQQHGSQSDHEQYLRHRQLTSLVHLLVTVRFVSSSYCLLWRCDVIIVIRITGGVDINVLIYAVAIIFTHCQDTHVNKIRVKQGNCGVVTIFELLGAASNKIVFSTRFINGQQINYLGHQAHLTVPVCELLVAGLHNPFSRQSKLQSIKLRHMTFIV